MTSQNIPAVVIEGVIKQFGCFAALRGVTGEFLDGKLYVIIGDNGAGKTTLLRVMAGLTHPTRGSISIFGTKRIKDICPQIGYMAHASLLYDEMSGIENLRYFAGLYGISESRCTDAIASVNLEPKLERPVGQYSQGMRQRMSLARAVLNNPRLLLLDEPFSNVDSHSASEMATLLGRMRDGGRTILLVTHQPGILESVADEFVWMNVGQIVDRTSTIARVH